MDTTGDHARGSVDTGQLLLVTLCLLGLIIAAFLAPVAAPFGGFDGTGDSGEGEGTGTPAGGSGTGATGTPAGGGERDATGTEGRPDGESPGGGSGTRNYKTPVDKEYPPQRDDDVTVLNGTRPVPIPGDQPGTVDGCGVVVDTRPVPGREITVSIYQDLEPAADTRVWFNGAFVGRTNENGNLTARVPYERQLNVTVESPANDPCQFFRPQYEEAQQAGLSGAESRGDGQAPALADAGAGATAGPTVDRLHSVRDPLGQSDPNRSVDGNNTGEYEVYGNATVTVDGRPYPGSTVVVTAAVDGVPMRQANVTVDGDRVGQTNGSGQYALTVPDTDRITVEVTRGDYTGGATVDVLQLSLQFTSADLFVVPGERAEVTATVSDEPATNATVTLDGRELGTTDANGTLQFQAPAQLSGSVTATTQYQSESIPLRGAFASTIWTAVALFVLSVLTTGVTAWARGRASAKRVAVGWAIVLASFVAFAVFEWVGLAAIGTLLALWLLYRLRAAVVSGAETTGSLLAGLLDGLRRGVIHVVVGIERLIDWTIRGLRRVAAWLGTLPRSLSGLARRLGGWLRRLPARLVGFLRRFSARRVGAVLAVGVLLVVAARFGGVYGFLGAAALVTLGLFAWWYRTREAAATEPAQDEDGTTTVPSGTVPESGSEPALSLRQLWRRLARWVMPESWRTRTPTEVAEAAIERGLPRGPVEALADAFRDVEYGGESPDGYREQAQTAYDALSEAREEDG